MERLRKQIGDFFGVTSTPAVAPTPPHPTDSHTTEHAADSAEVAAADTDSGLGPNSQAPTLRHDMHDQH